MESLLDGLRSKDDHSLYVRELILSPDELQKHET